MQDFLIWAHRGASAWAPENTMSAFRLALEEGADGLELDVHLSRDGVPVVIHDEGVGRTTDGRGAVSETDWIKISDLDAGSWFDEAFKGEPVPALVEVFQWNAGQMKLNVEIKEFAAGSSVLNLWRQFPTTRLLVSSFDHHLLQVLQTQEAGLPLGFVYEKRDWRSAVKRASSCNAYSFHPRHDIVEPEMLELCRELGLAVYPWTVDDPRRLEYLWGLGVDGVFCNDPGRVRSDLNHFKSRLDGHDVNR